MARKITRQQYDEGIRAPLPTALEQPTEPTAAPYDIADLIGSVHGLPKDLGMRKKRYLKATGYGGKRHR